MFRSVSSCTPNSQITVDFVSNTNQSFYLGSADSIRINGATISSLPVELAAGDRVSATVTTPMNYLGHQFHEYILNGQSQYFAVANKNLYQPVVKFADAPKRWFNYLPSVFQISFYSDPDKTQYPLGFGRQRVDIVSSHVVLDHINDAVCFYSSIDQSMIARVNIPGGPIEYRKTTYTKPDNTVDHEVIVLCNDKRLYKIRFDHQFFESDQYQPTVIPVGIPNNLPFEQDLPTGETYIEARRNKIRSKLSPLITAMDIRGSQIWLAGYDSVFILTKNFSLINHIVIQQQTINSIACINNDAIVTTRTGQAYYVSSTGTVTFLYAANALGAPCSINNGTAVALPDSNNQRILIFTDNSTAHTLWETPDFIPAYAMEFDGSLWVTGHDTNQVIKFNSPTSRDVYVFNDKVTMVSVINNSIIGAHYLQEFNTLESTGIKKIIPFTVESRKGPATHIGTTPNKIKMLGQEEIEIIPGPKLTCWVNGLSGELANSGDFVGVSYRATTAGKFRSAFVVGETAIDYDVEVFDQPIAAIGSSFIPNTVVAALSAPYTTNLIPTVGNLNSGTTGPINLGFDFGIFGNVYSQINVGTNGYITFGNSQPTQATAVLGGLNVDAIYAETQDLYQGNAINNSLPTSITSIPLSSGETPGVYYKTGTAGDFKFIKIRWVGTSMSSYPLGNNVISLTSISNWSRIPLKFSDLSKAKVNDFISGNGIVITTRITGSDVISIGGLTGFRSNSTTNDLYLTPTISNDQIFSSLSSNARYATVKNAVNGNIGYLQSFSKNTVSLSSTKVLFYSDVSNVFVIDGHVSGAIDNTWGLNFNYFTTGSAVSGINAITTINSIAISSTFVTVVSVFNSSSFYVSLQDFNSIFKDQTAFNSNITGGQSAVVSKISTDPNGPRIQLFGSHNLVSGDVITLNQTTLSLGFVPAASTTTPTLNSFVRLALNLTNTVGLVDVQSQPQPLEITGNYINLSTTATVSSNVVITAKTITATTPALTYEVGIYTDDYRQFVEFFYDSPNHNLQNKSGFGSGNLAYAPTGRGIATNTSGVFYSPDRLGFVWNFLGNGRVNTGAITRLTYRDPVIFKSESELENHARIEFVIDQHISSAATVLISADYGVVSLDTIHHDGQLYAEKNTLVSLTAPLNKSLSPIAPMITIGQHQIAVPMISSAVSYPNEVVSLFDNQPLNTLVSGTATVTTAGKYYFPAHYRRLVSYADIPITFTRTRNSQTVAVTTHYAELLPGDQITVSNFATSPCLYDTRDLVIVGPEILRLRWRTVAAGQLFNYLNFGTLIDPYAYNVEYVLTGTGTSTALITEIQNYQTPNFALTASPSITGNLFVDTPNVSIVINGTVYGNLALNVATNSNISLYREIRGVCSGNVTLYQILYDTVSSSNIYVPVGEWNVNNKIISSTATSTVATVAAIDLDSYFSESADLVSKKKIDNSLTNVGSVHSSRISSQTATAGNNFKSKIGLNFVAENAVNFGKINVQDQPVSQGWSFITGTISVGPIEISTPLLEKLIRPKLNTSSSMIQNRKIENFGTSETSKTTFIRSRGIANLNRSDSGETTFIRSQGIANSNRSDGVTFIRSRGIANLNRSDTGETTFIRSQGIANLNRSDTGETTFIRSEKFINSNRSDTSETTFIRLQSVGAANNSDSSQYNYIFVNDVQATDQSDSSQFSYFKSPGIPGSRETAITQTTQIDRFESTTEKTSFITVNDIKTFGGSDTSGLTYLTVDDLSIAMDRLTTSASDKFDSTIEIAASYDFFNIKSGIELPASYEKIATEFDDQNEKINYSLIDFREVDLDPLRTFMYVKPNAGNITSPTLIKTEYSKVEKESASSLSIFEFTPQDMSLSTLISVDQLNTRVDIHNFEFVSPEFEIQIDTRLLIKTFDIDNFLQSNQFEIGMSNQLFENDRYIYLNNDHELDIEPEYLHQLLPIQDVEPEYLHELLAAQDLETKILVQLTAEKDIQPMTPLELLPMYFGASYLIKDINYYVDVDVLWNHSDYTYYGAYKTEIRLFTAGGATGDSFTLYGPTSAEELGRLPFVFRSKTYDLQQMAFQDRLSAETQTGKYQSAVATKIANTDFWNYRIYLNNRRYSVPRKGRIFPVTWFKRGG